MGAYCAVPASFIEVSSYSIEISDVVGRLVVWRFEDREVRKAFVL
jgi:hypothetical protein